MAKDERKVVVFPGDEKLHERWLHVVYMKQRASNAPLAPRWMRFRDTCERGVGWLDLMEQWEKERFLGDAPVGFEKYVSIFMLPAND
jgi:hypothetical protein